MLSLAATGITFSGARADESIIKVDLDAGVAYIVTEKYALAHQTEIRANIPGLTKIDGFWTPTEVNVRVAERVFRELIHSAVKDPTLLFPDLAPSADPTVPVNAEAAAQLENERYELTLVSSNFGRYLRQYVGIIINDQKFVFCNYAHVPNVDPSAGYIFMDNVFVEDGSVHFLQCRFDAIEKTCSNVSLIGSWQRSVK